MAHSKTAQKRQYKNGKYVKVKEKKNYAPNKTEWSEWMIMFLKETFPHRFNEDIAKELCLGTRTIIRKARELGLEKRPDFTEYMRDKLDAKIKAAEGWKQPSSRATQFQPGHTPANKIIESRMKTVNYKYQEILEEAKRQKPPLLALNHYPGAMYKVDGESYVYISCSHSKKEWYYEKL